MATRTLELRFVNQFNRMVTVRVPNAREDLTGEEVSTVMDLLLTKNIFAGNADQLVDKHSARIVTRSVDDISIE